MRAKLSLLNREIGVYESGPWPAACPGVIEFLRKRSDEPYGIISSGHESFIYRMCRLWDVPYPRFLITDDDMRGLGLPVEVTSKPSGLLMQKFIERAAMLGYALDAESIIYHGDDPEKDGGLAKNGGVQFRCYNPDGNSLPAGMEEFRHFDELSAELVG